MSLIRKHVLPLSIVLVSIILAVLVLEAGLRIFESDNNVKWSVTTNGNIIRDREYKYDLDGLYSSESDTVVYKRNQYGLRDDCSDPSAIAILTIGGSTTDQLFVSFDATYQKVMQSRLEDEIGEFGCVTNAGVNGHSTWGHIFSFENWFNLIPEMSPKYVLLYIGVNDADFNRTIAPNAGFDTKDRGDIRVWLKQWRIVQRLLPIYRLIRQTIQNRNPAYATHRPQHYSEEDYTIKDINPNTELLSERATEAFRERMVRLISYIDDMGAEPICVSQPHRYVMEIDGEFRGIENVLGNEFSGLDYDYSYRAHNTVMSELCGDMYLDLYSKLYESNHFYDGVHTTALGSIYIGNLIADFLIENSLASKLVP